MQNARALLLEMTVGRIRILNDHLVNRIAAGEVVERPASVVKELVENAIDAGAASIRLEIEGGGKSRILVADDGSGMDRDDAVLALERHATSKIARFEDLAAVPTLGFRGEALPSIAAVARFTLRTAREAGEGTEVEVRGGKIVAVREIAHARGTVVDVSSLFFNVPARRKFLRSDSTELSHVVRVVVRQALARHAVGFHLAHHGRSVLDLPPVADPETRAAAVLGSRTAGNTIPFRVEGPGLVVHGLAGRPVDSHPGRELQYFFVNGRPVQDRVLLHAVSVAYGNTMPRDRYPAVILHVDLDPREVDVNVHPQKSQVRFGRTEVVHEAVREAIASALSHARAGPDLGNLRAHPLQRVVAALERHVGTAVGERAAAPWAAASRSGEPPSGSGLRSELPGRDAEFREPIAQSLPRFQIRDSYIVAEDASGLVLVDQHAAHERVLFERYLADAERDEVAVQPLLFPVVKELTPQEMATLEEESPEFERLGFRVAPFGGGTARIDAVPAVAAGLDAGDLLRELLGEAREARTVRSAAPELRRRLVTTAACHAAIKIRQPLSTDSMKTLLDDLALTRNPTTCPHGRPILFRLTLEEIERAFRRR